MKILCANWQADDAAELERSHYPDAEFIIARCATDVPATLDPVVCREVDAVINYSPTLTVAHPPVDFPNAKIAVRSGVGFDNIQAEEWAALNIPACNVPDYGTTEVADHAIALMLALTRGCLTYAAELIAGGHEGWHFAKAPLVRRHKGATFGIVGLGRIGLAAARRAAAFDMRVVFYDPYLSSGVDLSTGYTRVNSLTDLMAMADIVSIHAPLTQHTRGMMNDLAFATAKPGLILINTARGPIVDLDALEKFMRSGQIAGAGLDVLPSEPGDLEHPLISAWRRREDWIAERLILSPHSAFFSPDSMIDLRLKSIEVVHAYLAENRLTNCINSAPLK